MVLIFLSVFLLSSDSSNNTYHDFHLSRCEINYETATGDIQIAAHIFIDDLESALKQTGAKSLFIATPKESSDCNTSIEKYINQKLKIKVGNKILSATLLGKETSEDMIAIWCYLEIPNIKNIDALEVENKILNEMFNDQKNIVDFTINKKKKHFTIFDIDKVSDRYNLR